MPSTMEQSLLQAMTATFESLAFICPDETLSEAQSEAAVDVAVTVSFSGPLSGRLVLRATAEILPGIAENMLGAEGSYEFAVQRDALGELANVICGNLLPVIGGAKAVFVLTAPQEYVTGCEAQCTPLARASIGIDDGRAVAQLLFSDESIRTLDLMAVAA